MQSLFGGASSNQSLKKMLSQFQDLVTEPPAVKNNEEWFRLQTFNGWPFPKPRAAELAKAGLFYAPTEQNKDRCECFSCGKVFMEWEPDDDPLEAHRGNVPDCLFIRGRSNNVPLVSSYNKGASAAVSTAPKKSLLSSYVSALSDGKDINAPPSLPQKEREVLKFPEPPMLGRSGSGEEGSNIIPTQIAPRSTEEIDPEGLDEVEDLVVRLSKSGTKKGKRGKASQVVVLEKEQKKRDMLISQQRTEWTAIQLLIETSTKVLHEICNRQLGDAEAKVSQINQKVEKIAKFAAVINSEKWLKSKIEKHNSLQSSLAELLKKKEETETQLEALGKRSAVEKRDLDRLQKKEDLLAEYEQQSKAKEMALAQLERKLVLLSKEVETLEEEKARLHEEQQQSRTELFKHVESLKKEKMMMQAELVDSRDALERKKSEIEICDIKLKDWNRRQEIALSMEQSLLEREQQVAQREREVRVREETMQKREVELKEALEATRKARMKGGRNAVPVGLDGPVVGGSDMWEPEDDEFELESKREELFSLIQQ